MIRKCNMLREKQFAGFPPTYLLGSLILLFSLLLKIFFYSLEPLVSTDGCFYVAIIQKWHESGEYDATIQYYRGSDWLPPLPLWLIKSSMFFGISATTAGFAWAFVLGAALSVVAYGIASEITQNKKIAVATAFLTALHPSVNELGAEIQRDIFYLFFVGCSIWLICVASRRKKWFLWAVAAIPCGASVLCRFETFELLPLVICILFLLAVTKRIFWHKAVCYCCSFFAVFVATVIFLSFIAGTNNFFKGSVDLHLLGKWNSIFPQWRVKL
ncbi:MAG: glycosyltransferase family 39 protein [Lentisphaeria bacterium]|nr:glycosyltransferase family 39 protein [Lentisphaeria bacterium]